MSQQGEIARSGPGIGELRRNRPRSAPISYNGAAGDVRAVISRCPRSPSGQPIERSGLHGSSAPVARRRRRRMPRIAVEAHVRPPTNTRPARHLDAVTSPLKPDPRRGVTPHCARRRRRAHRAARPPTLGAVPPIHSRPPSQRERMHATFDVGAEARVDRPHPRRRWTTTKRALPGHPSKCPADAQPTPRHRARPRTRRPSLRAPRQRTPRQSTGIHAEHARRRVEEDQRAGERADRPEVATHVGSTPSTSSNHTEPSTTGNGTGTEEAACTGGHAAAGGERGDQSGWQADAHARSGTPPPARSSLLSGSACTPSAATMDEPIDPTAFVVGDSFARILTETTQSLVCVSTATAGSSSSTRRASGRRATRATRSSAATRATSSSRPRSATRSASSSPSSGTTGTSSPQVGHWMTKDGGRRLIAWSNRPMADAEGAPGGARHDRDRPDRSRAPRTARARAAGDPGAKLPRSAGSPPSSARCGGSRRSSRPRSPGAGVHAPSRRSARGCWRSTPPSSCATRATARRRSSAATTATASTSSISARVLAAEILGARSGARAGDARPDGRLGRSTGRRGGDVPCGYRSTAAAPIVVPARSGVPSRSPARTRCRPTPRTGSARSASWCRSRSRARRRARTSSPRAPRL